MLGPGHTTDNKTNIFHFPVLFLLPLFSSLGYGEVFLAYLLHCGWL